VHGFTSKLILSSLHYHLTHYIKAFQGGFIESIEVFRILLTQTRFETWRL